MIILSGDIGGTNTRLLLSDYTNVDVPHILHQASYPSADHAHLEDIVKIFMMDQPRKVERACLAIAGPIVEGSVKVTNLPWYICEKKLQRDLNIECVVLINDFAALGYGVLSLKPKDLHCLQKGVARANGAKSLMGAGTGLGVALMHSDGQRYHVHASEGGHVDFAPTTDEQVALLQYLRKRLHRVSIERVVSGIGLNNIYKFVRDNPTHNETENTELRRLLHTNIDTAATIATFATDFKDPMASRALKLFIETYGTCAGNLAVTTLPYGGFYIVGGIAPKLINQMCDGTFLNAFLDKGRMMGLLTDIPVYIVTNTEIGLQGAAYYAAHYL